MKYLHTLLFLLVAQTIFGQYQIGLVPRVSPDRTVSQKIGYTDVEVKYGSPSVKGRKILGELIPFDQVWRAGANSATTIEFSADIQIENQKVPKGKYAFFVLARARQKWVIILNKIHDQWGAFRYDAAEDAIRIEVMPDQNAPYHEALTYTIQQYGFQSGRIALHWEHIQVSLDFETDYLNEFIQSVEAKASEQPDHLKWVVWVQGADHLEQLNSALDQATQWLNQAEQLMNSTTEWDKRFYPKAYIKGHLFWVQAKLHARAGKLPEAVERVKALKAFENPIFYNKKRESEDIDGRLERWGKG